MSLFDMPSLEDVNALAKRSVAEPKKSNHKQELGQSPSSIKAALDAQSKEVLEYFKDSEAILITTKEQLHEYITEMIKVGIGGIDTETTGLDFFEDHIVGASLYYPSGVECYIPMKHIVPIFEEPYKNQLTYEEVRDEFNRFVENKTKLIYANAGFDLAMIYNSIGIDLSDLTYYDVLVAWRCIYGNEPSNALKILYNKYVLGGKGNPKKFSDFFSTKLYPYSKPEIAMLYAANDAKITYELYEWQLPYCTEGSEICEQKHLQAVSKLIWQIEFPMIKECFNLWKAGLYFDNTCNRKLLTKYQPLVDKELEATKQMVKEILEANPNYADKIGKRKLFTGYEDFNPLSSDQVAILLYDIMGVKKPVIKGKESRSTAKEVLKDINIPITNQILKYRGKIKIVNDFIEKPYLMVQKDHKIHAQFNQLGADTGRMSCEKPNLQQIPSHAKDIRHMFRATPGYVMISSDYSSQEPRIAAYVSQDKGMIQAFKDNKDIYSAIASMSFNLPYEQCLENNPETGEYQPEGYKRRNEAKKIVLGVLYGRSVPSIAEQLYGDDKDMSDKEKTAKAQKIFDAVLNNFSGLRNLMLAARKSATKLGYTETILGRRKYLPDLQLPEFTFTPMSNYVNPEIDPMDVSTLNIKNEIPSATVKMMLNKLKSCRYNGERYALIENYYNSGIQTTDNRKKIQDSVRQVVNGIIQGSAADQTKMAMLRLSNTKRWHEIGGRVIIQVHDELIAEVPIEHWQEGGEILSQSMKDAANFLPFPSKCDVTTTIRWNGLEFPCAYTKPKSIQNFDELTEDEIKWLQYQLAEMEYTLPVLDKEARGDAARGVNGQITEEMTNALNDYMSTNGVDIDAVLDHIENQVIYGGQKV